MSKDRRIKLQVVKWMYFRIWKCLFFLYLFLLALQALQICLKQDPNPDNAEYSALQLMPFTFSQLKERSLLFFLASGIFHL